MRKATAKPSRIQKLAVTTCTTAHDTIQMMNSTTEIHRSHMISWRSPIAEFVGYSCENRALLTSDYRLFPNDRARPRLWF